MNKNIIIGALIIVIVAIIGVFVFSNGKINTEINFLSESNLKNGNDIAIQLKDTQGNTLSEQNITIIYESNGNGEEYYVVTDSDGKAYLTLMDEPIGEHKVTVKYDGDDKYNGCTGEQTITISEGISEDNTQTQSTSTASTVKYHTNSSSATTGSNSKSNSTYNQNSQYNHKPNSTYRSNSTYKSNSSYKSNSTYNSNSKSNYNSNNYNPKKEYVSQLYYDSELKVYYDDFGTIHGGKYDGKEIVDVRANQK